MTIILLRYTTIIAFSWVATSILMAQQEPYNREPINYQSAPVNDAVVKLIRKVDAGTAKLDYDDQHGYLKSVLAALDISTDSQTLVFSKTSLQLRRISPERPRAIYFNDDVYVGWCQNGTVLEIAATDPKQGPTFYTLQQSPDGPPKFTRDNGQCLACHSSNRTQDVPGFLVRSVFPNALGHPELSLGSFTTDQTSPLSERWGGWYVTGTHGTMRHMGNAILNENDETLNREAGANLTTLDNLISTKPYMTPHSDIVALMVLEHQTQMHNAITAANFETRQTIYQSLEMNELLEREPNYLSESSQRRIDHAAERVLKHLLMCDEFPLKSPIIGTSGFSKEFQSRGVRDSKGRSLRDLDMKTRMFRYPCSYLIYSPAFDGLPDEVRRRIWVRLRAILEGRDDAKEFQHLSAEDRRQILEILNETKPEFKKTKS